MSTNIPTLNTIQFTCKPSIIETSAGRFTCNEYLIHEHKYNLFVVKNIMRSEEKKAFQGVIERKLTKKSLKIITKSRKKTKKYKNNKIVSLVSHGLNVQYGSGSKFFFY